MKIRIGTDGTVFWLETRVFFAWKTLPSLECYFKWSSIRFDKIKNSFYKDYESAREEYEKYNRQFEKRNVSYIYPNEGGK